MRSKRAKRGSQSGFSMTELVIVIGIILVVAAVAIPNGIRTWYNMELRATADQVASLMQQGRLMAAQKNAYFAVCYNTDTGVQRVYLHQTSLASSTPCTFSTTDQLIDLPRQITAASA